RNRRTHLAPSGTQTPRLQTETEKSKARPPLARLLHRAGRPRRHWRPPGLYFRPALAVFPGAELDKKEKAFACDSCPAAEFRTPRPSRKKFHGRPLRPRGLV